MNALERFFAMGGYAWFVWGAYGLSFALIALEIAQLAVRAHRKSAATPVRRPTTRVRYRGTLNEPSR